MISIIVPVYNTEKYLSRCVQSILEQTFADFELLLINDGSTDKSGIICEEIAKKDTRVRIFHKANGGVSSARNLGIDNAKGEWVTFVDSDDWIEKTYLQNLIEGNEEFDFIVNYYYAVGWDAWVSEPFENAVYRTSEIGDCLSRYMRKFSFVCCKMYRNKILQQNKIRFNTKISYAEDTIFTYNYFMHIESIRTLPDALYCYNCYPSESLSTKGISWETASYTIDELYNVISFVGEKYSWNSTPLKYYYMWVILRKYINGILRKPYSLFELRTELSKIMENKYVLEMFKSNSVLKSKFRKIFDLLMCHEGYLLSAIMLRFEEFLIRRKFITKT